MFQLFAADHTDIAQERCTRARPARGCCSNWPPATLGSKFQEKLERISPDRNPLDRLCPDPIIPLVDDCLFCLVRRGDRECVA
jgi:hypothetical protein